MLNQLRKMLAGYLVRAIARLWPEGKRRSEILSACSSLTLAMGKDAYEELTGKDADAVLSDAGTVRVYEKGTQF